MVQSLSCGVVTLLEQSSNKLRSQNRTVLIERNFLMSSSHFGGYYAFPFFTPVYLDTAKVQTRHSGMLIISGY